MEKYKIIDDKILVGYRYLQKHKTIQACDAWLDAWEDIKRIMDNEHIKDIPTLQEEYNWSDFLLNYVQDLESELHNAGIDDKIYFHKRIQYCEEMLKVCGNEDELLVENTRRAIADSHFYLGNIKECDQLYDTWLKEDPKWGWGYIGWADCYCFGTDEKEQDIERAEEIIRKALEEKDIRDRIEVVDRAIEIYQNLGNNQKAAELMKEFETYREAKDSTTQTSTPIKAVKIGRNDPCPCGSGKKYKKCCGK